jgi:UDP-4-amino-4,6-dideoxy-N-acetyl-beta-L-altrosamine transaminase
MIPYGKQDISDADLAAVESVLRSSMITQGPCVPKFEEAVANRVQAQFGVAVNSATSALHIACLALGVGQGDRVWTTAISFVASANCAVYCGAQVDFVDIDPDSFNMCANALAEKLARAEADGALPSLVIPVHMCGQSCDMKAIHALSQKYGFRVLEDASHAIGGTYDGLPVGHGQYSDVTVFSFHPVKIITTGEGGLAVTNNCELHQKMTLLRSHGVTRDPELMCNDDGGWYYEQVDLGFNYRMTDIAAALGLSQLDRLDEFVARRNALATRYQELLQNLPLELPKISGDVKSAFHLYVIRLRTSEVALAKRDVFNTLRERGLGVNLHYIPIYRHPYYQKMQPPFLPLPNAEDYYARAISIPLFATMTDKEQDTVVSILGEVLT